MTDVKKVAVVTGSAAGLGKAIATRLAKDGFRVVLHDINADNLNKVKAEFDAAGFENIAVKAIPPAGKTSSAWWPKQSRPSGVWTCLSTTRA